jgi:tetratricopeptide (TPR) repeat protein
MLSRVLMRRGHPLEARRLGRHSVEVAERAQSPALLANTLMHLGSAVIEEDSAEALQCYERALATFTQQSDLLGQARANINLGIAQSRLGAHGASLQAYTAGLALGRKIHSPDLTGLAALNLGVLHMKLGAYGEADAAYSEAMERFALLKNEPHRLAALYNQANLAREQHEHERAARLYGDAAVLAAVMNQLDVEVGARAGQGLAWVALEREDDARACLQSCAVRLRDQPEWWFQGREMLEALGVRLAVRKGDAALAAQRFAEGMALAERSDQYGMAWFVADVAGPLAQVGVQAGWEQVERLAGWVEGLDYAPLTARYDRLREQRDLQVIDGR